MSNEITFKIKDNTTIFKVGKEEFYSLSVRNPEEICKILELAKNLTQYERGFLDDLVQMIK